MENRNSRSRSKKSINDIFDYKILSSVDKVSKRKSKNQQTEKSKGNQINILQKGLAIKAIHNRHKCGSCYQQVYSFYYYFYHNSLVLRESFMFLHNDIQISGKLQKMKDKEMLFLDTHKLEIYLFTMHQNLFYFQEAYYTYIFTSV